MEIKDPQTPKTGNTPNLNPAKNSFLFRSLEIGQLLLTLFLLLPVTKFPVLQSQSAPQLICTRSRGRLYFSFAGSKLLPDFFLDVEGYDPHKMIDKNKKTTQSSPQGSSGGGVAQIFDTIKGLCNEELVQSVNGVFQFHLEGTEPGKWYLDLKNNSGTKTVKEFSGITNVPK